MNALANAALPAELDAIQREVCARPAIATNLDNLQVGWQAALDDARRDLPGLTVAHGGEAVHLGPLSPGCQACKAGLWSCLFVQARCNLACGFCLSPTDLGGLPISDLGATPDAISANQRRLGMRGVAFTGGEPFLDVVLLCGWLAWTKSETPDVYTWVYTNGVLANDASLAQLAALGLDEIRFDMAATGYNDPAVLAHLAAAAERLPTVTVEIPAIPEHRTKLMASLPLWAERGVRHLNLHTLMYEPGSRSATWPGTRQEIILPDGHRTWFNPDSQALALDVMRAVQSDKLDLAVNHCSMLSKVRQIRKRRRALARITARPWERFEAPGVLVSHYVWRPSETSGRFQSDPPDQGERGYRVARMAPLGLCHNSGDDWLSCVEIVG